MDFLSAGMTKVVVLERWLLAEVQLYFLTDDLRFYQVLAKILLKGFDQCKSSGHN